MSKLADNTNRARMAIERNTRVLRSPLDTLFVALKKVPAEIRYTLLLFLTSRVALTIIGVFAHEAFRNRTFGTLADYFKIWAVWDSTWYITIAKSGYSAVPNMVGMHSYTFFPLYPMLMRLPAMLIGDYYWSGIIVSNAALLVACLYMYRLVRLESDEPTAMRSIKYLFLFPTAFVLSGVFTESLFLALSLMSFYYAKKGNWLLSGALGFFTSLTRPYGVIIMIPLAFEYLRSIGFRLDKIRADVLCLLMVPAGISMFAAYNYMLTGDPLAFANAQGAWGSQFYFPVQQLWERLHDARPEVLFNACFSLTALALLLIFYKKVDLSYWIYGAFLILIPLSSSDSAWSMSRYIVVAFPLFIIFANLGEDRRLTNLAATVILALAQGLLMAVWTTSFFYVI